MELQCMKASITSIPVAAASLLILLFFYTAISKLGAYAHFEATLLASPVTRQAARLFAVGLPVAELVVCALLFFPATRRVGLWASLLLMAAFTLYIFYMLAFVPQLPCSCGGVLRQLSWTQHAWFNVFFTLVAATGLYYEKKMLYNTAAGQQRQGKPKTC